MKASLFLLVWFCLSGAMVRGQQVTSPAPPAPPAQKDVLVFTNGDQLSGTLKSASGGNVVFHSDMAGDLTIPFAKVEQLRSGSAFVALQPAGPDKYKAVASGSVDFHGDEVTLTPNAVTGGTTMGREADTFPVKQLSYLIDVASYSKEVDHHSHFTYGWTGSATAGVTLVRSTQSSTTFTGALNFVRQIPTVPYLPRNHRTTINITETYGTSSTPVIPPTVPASAPVVIQTSLFHADADRDQYFSPKLFALVDVAFDHNFASGLQLQQLYGLGVGWTPFQNDTQQLDLKADAHYEKQQFLQTAGTDLMNTNLIGSTFQENYRRSLPRKMVLTEWANILPAWNDLQAYSANAYLGVALPLFRRLNISLSGTDNYLNNPAAYYRANTVQLVTGLTYTFK